MARHTIGYQRGSVRGAPPDVYVPFGTFGDDDDPAPWQDSFDFFLGLLIAAVAFLIVFFCCVAWYALQAPDYTDYP